ncbi:MAG: hypothetical protein WEA81_02210, partial [Dehalococcoidia bacterium]
DGPTWAYVALAGTAMLTAIYTTRLVLLTFFGDPKDHHAYEHAHESGPAMAAPLVFLAVLATIAGFVVFDQVGEALGFAGGIGALVYLEHPHAFTSVDYVFAAGATASAVAGIIIGWAYWHGDARRALAARLWAPDIHAFLVNRWYMDHLYQSVIDRVILGLASVVAWFDKKIVN